MNPDAGVSLAPNSGTAADARPAARVRPTAGQLYWLLSAVSLVIAGSVMFGRYLFWDTFYDLYAGRYIVSHGIPRTNVATVASAGASWVDQQWLAHLLYYAAWAFGGYRLLAAVSAVGVTAGFALLALLMLRRGVPALRAFEWTAAAFAVCFGSLIIRAESLAYPLFAATVWLLLEDERSARLRRRTWVLIPVIIVWVNTHGSALLGAGVVVLYAAYRVLKALIMRDVRGALGYVALGLAAGACLLCTPYGAAIIADDLSFVGSRVLARNIVEWAPQRLGSPVSWIFFAMAAATTVAVRIAWRRGARPDPLLAGLTMLLLGLSIVAVRNQVWFGISASLLASEALARAKPDGSQLVSAALARLTAIVLGALALASVITLAVTPERQFYREVPLRSIDAAAQVAAMHPAMKVLGDEASGSAMLWLHPSLLGRVGFDWRLDQYSASQLTAYFDFALVRGRRWQRVMHGYDIVVVSRTQDPRLAAALTKLAAWRVVHRDAAGLVLVRRAGSR
jgi:hypothetical protein